MSTTSPPSPVTGTCYCGAVKYTVSEPITAVYICHCTQCRRQSGSAFGISCLFSWPAFELSPESSSKTKIVERKTASGQDHQGLLCSDCGTRIWNRAERARAANKVYVKGGTVDDGLDLTDAIHIWTKEKLPGVVIPESATQYEAEPPGN